MDKRGLTLLEVLIAIAISSVIIFTLYMTVSNSINVMSSSENSLSKYREISIVVDSLRREIETTVFRSADEMTHFYLIQKDYYGRPIGEVRFVGLNSTSRGLFVINYKAEEIDKKIRLLKRIYPVGSTSDKAKWEVLLDEIYSFSVLAYSGKEAIKIWDSNTSKSVPMEVKIDLQIKPAESDKIIFVSDRAVLRINRSL